MRLLSIASLMVAVFTGVASVQQIDRPFPGFLFESNLLVSTLRHPSWNGAKQGLSSYDRLLTANGNTLATAQDLERIVQAAPLGTPIVYEYLRGKEKRTVSVETQMFGVSQFACSMMLNLLSGTILLLIGTIVFWLRPKSLATQAHLLMTLFFGLTLIGFCFEMQLHRYGEVILALSLGLGSSLIHLALTFPVVRPCVRNRPYLAYLPYVPAFVIGAWFLLRYRPLGQAVSPSMVDTYFTFLNLWSVLMLVGLVWLLGSIFHALFKAPTLLARNQALIVLGGVCGAFLPLTLNYVVPELVGSVAAIAAWQIAMVHISFHFFPLSVAYAILRHQLFDIQLVVRRATLYAALTLGLTVLYMLCATLAFRVVGTLLPSSSGASLPGFFAAVAVAIAFRPLHDALRRAIDRLFLGERADALQVLKTFSQSASTDEGTLAQELAALIRQALTPQWVGVQVNGRLLAVSGTPSEVPLIEAGLMLPIKLEGDHEGALFLGPRTNEMPYSPEELAMLKVLAAQAALAFKNAHLFAERVQLLVQEGVSRTLAHERKQLLMQVVHDLKSDLFNIGVAVQLRKKAPSNQRPLDSITRSVGRIEHFLEEKIRLIRDGREAGQATLREAVEGVQDSISPQLGEKRQTLDLRLGDEDVVLPISRIEFEQVALNLLGNASKFAPPDTVVGFEAKVVGSELVVIVTDEGAGIPAELMADLGSGKRAITDMPGSGFGLQNVKAVLERIGGGLMWRNGERGAIFEAHLPLASVEPNLLAEDHGLGAVRHP